MQAKIDSKAGKKRFKGRQEKNQRQAIKESKACKTRLQGRQAKTQRQTSSKDSKADKQRLKSRQGNRPSRQEKAHRHTRKY